jgi:hypothetical protein
VPLIIMGLSLRQAGRKGRMGWVRSSA